MDEQAKIIQLLISQGMSAEEALSMVVLLELDIVDIDQKMKVQDIFYTIPHQLRQPPRPSKRSFLPDT